MEGVTVNARAVKPPNKTHKHIHKHFVTIYCEEATTDFVSSNIIFGLEFFPFLIIPSKIELWA